MRALVLIALVACSAGEPGPGIDVNRAMQHARVLAETIGPRPGESDAAKRAAAYIEQQLGPHAERGHVGTVELPAIEVLGVIYRHAHRTLTTDTNVIARFGPNAPAILVMAHYDSVRSSPGAVDNAAAVGVLLELARVFAEHPPKQPVILAFTAREEDGLIGAEALAAQMGTDVAFAISLDLIGGDGDLVLNGASKLIGITEMQWLADAADRAGVALRVPLAHRVVSRWWPQAERSDHGAFTRRGIRAVHFYDRGHDGEWIDRAYHTRFDTFARIDRGSVDELGRLLRALVDEAVPAHDGDPFWVPVLANVVVPRWSVFAFELACALGALALLVGMRRERQRGGAGLVAGSACFIAAVACVYVLERAAEPAWLHAPGYHVIALALVFAGVLGLASRIVARVKPWGGAQRYLAVCVAWLLAFGLVWIAIGAIEIAWVWLVPALVAATAPLLGRARVLALVPTLLPAVLVLAPAQLREAVWNGFASPAMPLVGWITLVAIPPITAAAYALRARGHSGPLGTLVLPLGCALAILVGTALVLRYEAPCTAAQFRELSLTCEIASGV
jgi:hypothetical protein